MKTIILYANYLGFFYCCYYKIQKKKRQEKKDNLISFAGHVKEVSALEPEGTGHSASTARQRSQAGVIREEGTSVVEMPP